MWHPNSGIMTVLFLTMLVFLTFPACGMPSSADTQIHIAGINPPSAYPNETVHPYGNGATPNSTVTAMLSGLTNQIYTINATNPWIIMPGGNLTLGSNCSSLIGDWQVDFVTPFVYPACYSVVIFDNSSLTNDSVSLCVLMKAVIGETLPGLNFTYGPGNLIILTPNLTGGPLSFYLPASATPSSGPAGMFVTLHGRFASGGQITVYFENSQVATITDQPAGNWSVSFQVPSVPPGNYTIRAIDVDGRWMSVAPFVVTAPIILPVVTTIFFPMLVAALMALGALASTIMLMFIAVFHRKRRRKQNASAF